MHVQGAHMQKKKKLVEYYQVSGIMCECLYVVYTYIGVLLFIRATFM
jgi:hypothetical protein